MAGRCAPRRRDRDTHVVAAAAAPNIGFRNRQRPSPGARGQFRDGSDVRPLKGNYQFPRRESNAVVMQGRAAPAHETVSARRTKQRRRGDDRTLDNLFVTEMTPDWRVIFTAAVGDRCVRDDFATQLVVASSRSAYCRRGATTPLV